MTDDRAADGFLHARITALETAVRAALDAQRWACEAFSAAIVGVYDQLEELRQNDATLMDAAHELVAERGSAVRALEEVQAASAEVLDFLSENSGEVVRKVILRDGAGQMTGILESAPTSPAGGA